METNESFVMAAFYAVMGTLIFNSLRFELKLNLFSSLILSGGMFLSLYYLLNTKGVEVWISEYIYAVVILEILVVAIVILGSPKRTFWKDNNNYINNRKE